MAVTEVLALFWQSSHLEEGDRHDKDSRNSGPGLGHHRWHGTDNGLWVWSSPTRTPAVLGEADGARKGSPTSTSLEGAHTASRGIAKPEHCLPKPQRRQGCEGPGSARFTSLLDFRDCYYTRSGLLDHLDSDGFDYWSDRPFHFPGGFLHWRGFGLGPGNRSLCRFRSLGCLACLTALS
jgi:hypothetical protein